MTQPDSGEQAVLGGVNNIASFVLGVANDPAYKAPVGFNDAHPYTVYIYMGDTKLCCPIYLVHATLFRDDEMQAMVKEVADTVLEQRIKTTRKQAVLERENIVKQAYIDKTNQECFQTHVLMFTGIICDKFNFRQMVAPSIRVHLEPTLNFKAPVA